MPTDFEAVGKPNVMLTLSGFNNDNSMAMNQLSTMQADEFVETAERLASDKEATKLYEKVFD
jgi:hypothetical protein